MKKILSFILSCSFLLVLCSCSFFDTEPTSAKEIVYHVIDEDCLAENETIVYNIKKIDIGRDLIYPGTQDLRSIIFDVNVSNNNTNIDISFPLSEYEWTLIIGDYSYICKELNGTKNIKPGGFGVLKPYFSIPDAVYQKNNIIILKLRKKITYYGDFEYEMFWMFELLK